MFLLSFQVTSQSLKVAGDTHIQLIPEMTHISPSLEAQGAHCVNNSANGNMSSLTGPTQVGPVINLSSLQLTPAMITLLSKGLNFCPTPGEPDKFSLRKSLDTFHVSLRRFAFFNREPDSAPSTDNTSVSITPTLDLQSEPEEQPLDHPKFRLPSKWNPKGPPLLETFITVNECFLNDRTLQTSTQQNLSYVERQALAELKKAHNIVIKPADKGSAVVIQNREDYITEGLRQLSDPSFYRETNEDLTSLHNDLITDLINHLHSDKQISDKCRNYLLNTKPRTAQLYLLPKIHKNKTPVPGRPIVSANNSPTEKISQLADIFLQPRHY
jgi:hypothetical protein